MKEILVGVFIGVALAAAVDMFSSQFRVHHGTIVRNCSLTGTYVIDNDTVLACRVIKRNTNEAKPSEPKEEEQSL